MSATRTPSGASSIIDWLTGCAWAPALDCWDTVPPGAPRPDAAIVLPFRAYRPTSGPAARYAGPMACAQPRSSRSVIAPDATAGGRPVSAMSASALAGPRRKSKRHGSLGGTEEAQGRLRAERARRRGLRDRGLVEAEVDDHLVQPDQRTRRRLPEERQAAGRGAIPRPAGCGQHLAALLQRVPRRDQRPLRTGASITIVACDRTLMIRLRRGNVPRVALPSGGSSPMSAPPVGEDPLDQAVMRPRAGIGVAAADDRHGPAVRLHRRRVRRAIDADRQAGDDHGAAVDQSPRDARRQGAPGQRRPPRADHRHAPFRAQCVARPLAEDDRGRELQLEQLRQVIRVKRRQRPHAKLVHAALDASRVRHASLDVLGDRKWQRGREVGRQAPDDGLWRAPADLLQHLRAPAERADQLVEAQLPHPVDRGEADPCRAFPRRLRRHQTACMVITRPAAGPQPGPATTRRREASSSDTDTPPARSAMVRATRISRCTPRALSSEPIATSVTACSPRAVNAHALATAAPGSSAFAVPAISGQGLLPGLADACRDHRAGFRRRAGDQVHRPYARHLHLEVQAVQERAADPADVALRLPEGAGAGALRVSGIAAAARVHVRTTPTPHA